MRDCINDNPPVSRSTEPVCPFGHGILDTAADLGRVCGIDGCEYRLCACGVPAELGELECQDCTCEREAVEAAARDRRAA